LTFSFKRDTDKHKVLSSWITTTLCSNSDRSTISLKNKKSTVADIYTLKCKCARLRNSPLFWSA